MIEKLPALALREIGKRYTVEVIVEEEAKGSWRAAIYPGGGLSYGGLGGSPAAAVRAATVAWEKQWPRFIARWC